MYVLTISPNIARYPQQHLKISQILMAVLAMDTIGHLTIPFKSNKWTLEQFVCIHLT